MNTLIIIGIVAGWIACGAGSYLLTRNGVKPRERWTRGDRISTLTLSIFGPLSLFVALLLCDDNTPAKW